MTTKTLSERPANPNEVVVFGVRVANLSHRQAIERLEHVMNADQNVDQNRARGVYIVNAHTLNLACEDPRYREVLQSADFVLGDGTGVRWAARKRGVEMRANMVGTDLIPALFAATADRKPGYRCFLLGADAPTVERAAEYFRHAFPGWTLAGFHHGYVNGKAGGPGVVEQINAARPHLLLVAMGNPLQERWIHDHLERLRVPVSIGVGGLFDYWGGNVTRAPAWMRRYGIEWVQRLWQRPGSKWRRYLLGNPLFLLRMLYYQRRDLAVMETDPA